MDDGDGWSNGAPPQHRTHLKCSVVNVAGNRRRRNAVQIGKERREAVFRAKRLRIGSAAENGEETEYLDVDMDEDASEKALEEKVLVAVEELKVARQTAESDLSRGKIEALRNVRRVLSTEAPPLNAAVNAGVVSLLVDSLGSDGPEEVLEAAWCLSNIASGERELTRSVVPALPMLISHLADNSGTLVVEQCAWAVANVAGEDEEMRNILLAQGALRPLGNLIGSRVPSLARTAAWAMSNLIKGPTPAAASELMKMDGMPQLLVGLMNKGEEKLVVELSWIMVYLTAKVDAHSEILMEAGLLPLLVSQLGTSDRLDLLTPMLRCLGNIVAGDNSKTDAVLAAGADVGGITGCLTRCLDMDQRAIQKQAAWAVSNIAAGTLMHKQIVFQGGAVPSLLRLLATGSFDVRKEVAHALGNVCVYPKGKAEEADPIVEHLTTLVEGGCIPGFLSLVKSPDTEAARLGLIFIELVLRCLPNGRGPAVVEKEDGIAAMEVVEYHENEDLRNMACGIIDKYYGEDYGLEEECGPEDGEG